MLRDRQPLHQILILFLLCAAGPAILAQANQDDEQDAIEYFEKHVRPVLHEHCLRCHGEKKQKGGLRLDSANGWERGGDSGPAVIPHDDQSLLLRAIRYEDPALEMPPKGKLPPRTVAALEQWIASGAVDPRFEEALGTSQPESPTVHQDSRSLWSLQPLVTPVPPQVRQAEWPASEIDRFILAGLEREGLSPNPPAERTTLLRRIHYDLVGLPPTPQQINDFLNDPSEVAFEKVVDQLLDSPQFGQRWGRHWLDVVRFAESSGGGRTLLLRDAWRFRDYVIDSFNHDVPYDQFVTEQIAGDLLHSSDWQERQRNLIATGFLLLGPTNYEMQDKDILEMDVIDEQLDTIGKAFLGMTIGCARCHDHKFDPIPASDYYAMAGIFKSTQSLIHSNVSSWNTVALPLPPDDESRLAEQQLALNAAQADLQEATDRWKRASKRVASESGSESESESGKTSGDPVAISRATTLDDSPDQEQASVLKARVEALQKEVKRLEKSILARPVAIAVQDHVAVGDMHVAIRGVPGQNGALTPRGVIQAASWKPFAKLAPRCSGRHEFAKWISDARHPLTARVMANRIWYWMMGRGIVRSVDNFGHTGDLPTDPALLDYLAGIFIDNDWSVKRLVKRIAMSHVYQLSSEPGSAANIDQANRMYWRANRKRLRAEDIRDSILMVAGSLNDDIGGPGIKPGTTIEYGYEFDSLRRSVYLPVFRNTLPQIFEVFDFADPNIQGGQRTSSTIASQALWMMNHPMMVQQSNRAASRLLAMPHLTDGQRIDHAYWQVINRLPTATERAIAIELVQEDGQNGNHTENWAMLYQVLFQCIDFRYLN